MSEARYGRMEQRRESENMQRFYECAANRRTEDMRIMLNGEMKAKTHKVL